MTKTQQTLLNLSPVLGACLYTLLSEKVSSFLAWIDGITYTSLLLLMVSGVLFIRNGKFFSAFADSCNRFFSSLRKKEAFIREREGRKQHVGYQSRSLPFLPVFGVGISYFLVSLLLSFLYVFVL